jgi:hypothetical protein
LTVGQLEMAVALQSWPDPADLSGSKAVDDYRRIPSLSPGISDILRSCGSLLQYGPYAAYARAQRVSISQTAQVFLLSGTLQKDTELRKINPGTYQEMCAQMLNLCVRCLTNASLRDGFASDLAVQQRELPLLPYCARFLMCYWKGTIALGQVPLQARVVYRLKLLCQHHGGLDGFWASFMRHLSPDRVPGPGPNDNWPLLTPLGYASSNGLTFMVDFILQNGSLQDKYINTPSGQTGLTPLARAIYTGSEQIAVSLLNAGARFCARDMPYLAVALPNCSLELRRRLEQLVNKNSSYPVASPAATNGQFTAAAQHHMQPVSQQPIPQHPVPQHPGPQQAP